ncbi:unnamed protein product [Closterium sp. NIES-54]
MVTTTTPGGSACVDLHVNTDGSSPGHVHSSAKVESVHCGYRASSGSCVCPGDASGLVAPPFSCRLLSHQTLLWHHLLGHPSLPRLRGMHSRLLRAAPHSSSFPPMTAPLQNLHMDVWGPTCVSGQGRERYFQLVVDDYTRYTTVFPLRSKGEVPDVLIPWIRAVRLRLGERFGEVLPVLRLHSDRGGEFSSDHLQDFCRGEGITRSFTLPASPQHNGIAEHRIGLVMEVARTSMIRASAPHFLWPFAVGDVSVFRVWGSRAFVRDTSADKLSARAIPCVFLGFVPNTPSWQFYHPTSRRVFPSQDVTLDESVPFYRLFLYRSTPPPPSPLFLAPGPPPVDPLPPQGRAPSGVSQVDPLPGTVPVEVAGDLGAARGAPSGGAKPGGAESEGVGSGGVEPVGAEPGGAEPGGAETVGVDPGGAEPKGVEPGVAESEGAESGGARPQGTASAGDPAAVGAGDPAAKGTGAGGARVTAGAGGTGGAAAAGSGDACTRGTGAAGTSVVGGARAGDPMEPGAAEFGVARAGGPGARGAGVGGAGAGGTSAGGGGGGGVGAIDPRAGGAGKGTGGLTERREPASRPASPVRAGRRVSRQRPPSVPGTHAMALRPSSVPLRVPLPAPPESSLPAVPDPESDCACAASPTVAQLLASVVTDPSFESTAASALVAELLDFATTCRLDYSTDLIAESESASPPSVRGRCALGMDVLEDRQEDFDCLAAAVPHFASMLLAPEGDSHTPDIPTPRSYVEAITGPYSSQWQTAMDAEMASWKSTGTYVDVVPSSRANIVDGMWIFRVKRPPDSPPAFKARYVARGFSQRQRVDYFHTFSPTPKMTTLRVLLHVAAQRDYELHSLDFIYGLRQAPREWHDTLRTTLVALGFTPFIADPSLFLCTNTSLPPFYVLVYVDDLVFATAYTEALTLVKSKLQKRHTCTDLGELRSYLGLHITRDRARRTITLTHSHMVLQVLQRFGFQFSSPQPTPLSSSHSLSAPPLDESVEPNGPYPELVGCFITLGMGLVLGGQGPVVLTGHADASWVDDSAPQRSSQGYTFSLGSCSISWRSTRSSSVLSSSFEAEIYAGAMAAQELR